MTIIPVERWASVPRQYSDQICRMAHQTRAEQRDMGHRRTLAENQPRSSVDRLALEPELVGLSAPDFFLDHSTEQYADGISGGHRHGAAPTGLHRCNIALCVTVLVSDVRLTEGSTLLMDTSRKHRLSLHTCRQVPAETRVLWILGECVSPYRC